jgi:hypothetical protein
VVSRSVAMETAIPWLAVSRKPRGDRACDVGRSRAHPSARAVQARVASQASSIATRGAQNIGASGVVHVVETVRVDLFSGLLERQLPLVSACIKEGFDEPDKLLLFWHLRRFGGRYPRVAVLSEFVRTEGSLTGWSDEADVDERRNHIRQAWGDA